MKKTLIALALTTLAATAFARTPIAENDKGSIYFDGLVRYYHMNSNLTVGDTKDETTKSDTLRLRFGLGGNFKVSDTDKAGAYVRFQKDFGSFHKTDNKTDKEISKWHNEKQVKATKFLGWYDSAKYGSFTLLAKNDVGIADDYNYAGNGDIVVDFKSAYQEVIGEYSERGLKYVYKNVPNLELGASYTDNRGREGATEVIRNYEFVSKYKVTPEFSLGLTGVYSANDDNPTANKDRYAFDARAIYSANGLTLGAVFGYGHEKTSSDATASKVRSLTNFKRDVYVYGVRADYVFNDYFKPYASYGIVQSKATNNAWTETSTYNKATKTNDVTTAYSAKDAKTDTTTRTFDVGVASTVYKYKTTSVTVRLEYANQVKSIKNSSSPDQKINQVAAILYYNF